MDELKNLECLNIKTQTNVDDMMKFTSEKAFDGRRLINYMIRIFEVMSMDFCDSMICVEPDCVRINLDKRVKKDEEEGPLFLSSI